MQCQDCRFYEPVSSGLLINSTKQGMCHCHPPIGFPINTNHSGQLALQFIFQQPQVQPNSWCGEFELKDQGGPG